MLARTSIGVVTLLWLAMAAGTSHAQDSYALLDELYGRGVHAYFARDYVQALRSLDTAASYGTRDPRAFYFRGLTLLRFGRTDEAEHAFRTGAGLEFSTEGATTYLSPCSGFRAPIGCGWSRFVATPNWR